MVKKIIFCCVALCASCALHAVLPSDFDVTLNSLGQVPGTETLFLLGASEGSWSPLVLPDGKIIVPTVDAIGKILSLIRVWSDGQFDDTFGVGGFASLTGYTWTGSIDGGYSMALQSDGKILVACSDNGSSRLVVARFMSSGSMDPSFGVGGIVTLAGVVGRMCSIAIRQDGKIVVGARSSALSEMLIARFDQDGSLDVTFGSGGVAIISGLVGEMAAIALQGDNKIAVGWNTSAGGVVVARLTIAGSLDAGFGSGGVANVLANGRATGLAVQLDGSIVIGGANGVSNPFVARLTSVGVLDGAFGSGGVGTVPLMGIFGSIVPQPDGKIVGGGYYFSGANLFMLAARLTDQGALDSTFSPTGYTTFQIGGLDTVGMGVTLQPDGKIILGGININGKIVLARLYGDAQPPLPPVPFDQANAQALQSAGKLVVVGFANDGTMSRFAAARVNSTTGVLDTTFNGTGKQTVTIGTDAQANAVAITSSSKILMAGYAIESGVKRFAIAQLASDGVLDSSFGTGGVVTLSIGTEASANALALLSNGNILIGGYAIVSGLRKFALVCLLPDGTLNTAFGTDGVVTFNIGSYSLGRALSVLSGDKVMTSGYGYNGEGQFALARLLGRMSYAEPLPSALNYDPCNASTPRVVLPAGSLDQKFNPTGNPAGTELISFIAGVSDWS